MIRKRGLVRTLNGLGAALLIVGLTAGVFLPGRALAAAISGITLNLGTGTITSDVNTDGIPDGGSMPGGSANYQFKFAVPNSTSVDTIIFEFCKKEIIPSAGITTCDAPTGMNANNANLALGNDDTTGWTINTTSSTANEVIVSGTATALPATSTFRLDSIVNSTDANTTFYAYIAAYSGGTSGTLVYDGSTAASTADAIELIGTMPESLVFCTGHTVDINGSGIPDCTTAANVAGGIPFNQLFDPNQTAWAFSQMAAATNAGSGYAITVTGPTLTSGGSNPISAMNTTDISRPGTSQFGMNLIDDSTPTTKEPDNTTAIASDPTIGQSPAPNPITYYNGDSAGTGAAINPVSDGTNYYGIQQGKNGTQTTSYNGGWPNGTDNTGDTNNYPTYSFKTGDIVAASDWGASGQTGTSHPSNTQRYTSTYIVNVPGNQPAGTYATTLTYICTPTF